MDYIFWVTTISGAKCGVQAHSMEANGKFVVLRDASGSVKAVFHKPEIVERAEIEK